MKNENIVGLINEKYSSFSKGQKVIADFILKEYKGAKYMTAAEVAEVTGLSEVTVVRFAYELGFEGYPKFQRALKDSTRKKLTTAQRLEFVSEDLKQDTLLQDVLNTDMKNMVKSLQLVNQDNFNTIVKEILNAKRIYILGVRSSAPLASFLGFYFNLIFSNIRLVHTTSVSEMFEQIINIEKGDVIIGVSFPRYSKRTIRALEYAKSQGATAIAITDSDGSPLKDVSDYTLEAVSDMTSFVDSLVAPLSVINALIIAIGIERKKHLIDTFDKLENIWDESNVYLKEEE